jgi:hypothetical protein
MQAGATAAALVPGPAVWVRRGSLEHAVCAGSGRHHYFGM